MISKESAYQKISELVERFEEQYASYMKTEYNETLTRRDFIDPFFKALGWDMDNEQGYAEAYREVIHEDRLKIGTANKAPDYSFRLAGGKRLFFVEAKKPGVSVKDEIQPAYQIRRYGWSAKLPISIITDFQELSIYDCTVKPNPTDKASVARIGYLTFHEYLSKFDFIWDTFSKERVLKGSFDKFVQSDTQKKGTATVDKEFLQSLDRWRTYLATSISWNNKELDEDEINFAVQQTIDRIIFLRIAEDRSVEPYGNLKHTLGHGDYYQNLFEQFRKADEKYNSGLFDFNKDRICEHLKIDNKIIKTLVNELYYPECPYEFSVLSVEILGSAYEQFLGKVIRITPAHHAKIEEKPEVRKAGGVYYTPQYIVEYIVQHTVGKLVEGKTPAEVNNIKIVDPACGSGSFLIGAYQYLLDWHKQYYSVSRKPSKGKKDNPLTPDGYLTTAEKKRILLNNIYGVDIDVNAVEVTKLSLLLKCLEGETEASIQQQFSLWNERVLPTLDNNIKSGNSLIDTDFYSAELDFGLEKKIKPFNWKNAFPEVFKQGGFDAVIGNPPYGATLSIKEDAYLRSKYQVANYQLDSYVLFIERGKSLSRRDGYLGFIIPSAWVASTYDIKIRKYISEECQIKNFVITPKRTFKEATVETCVLIITNENPIESFRIERWDLNHEETYTVDLKLITASNNYLFPVYSNESKNSVVGKIRNITSKLNDFADVIWGVKIYENGKGTPPQKGNESKTKVFHSSFKKSSTHRPLIGGGEISRYQLNWKGGFVDYGRWLAAPRSKIWFEGERIIVREITAKGIIQATIIDGDYVFSNSVDGIKVKSIELSIKVLLAIINSKLISFYHSNTSANAFKGTFPKLLLQNVRELPIPFVNNKIQEEVDHLVDQLLQLYADIKDEKLPSRIDQIKSKIDYCENRINEIVYQLYGLTEEEIKIVEGH
jgi:type I restriction-modification system DNA methylase subunit